MLNKIKKHYLILLASYLSEDCPYLCNAFRKLGLRSIFLCKEYEMLKLLVEDLREPLKLSQFLDEEFWNKQSVGSFTEIRLRLRLEIVESWIELLGCNLPLEFQVEITRSQVRREMNEAFK